MQMPVELYPLDEDAVDVIGLTLPNNVDTTVAIIKKAREQGYTDYYSVGGTYMLCDGTPDDSISLEEFMKEMVFRL